MYKIPSLTVKTGSLAVDKMKQINCFLTHRKAWICNKLKESVSHRIAFNGFKPYYIIRDARADGTVHKGRDHGYCSRCVAKPWVVDFEVFSANELASS